MPVTITLDAVANHARIDLPADADDPIRRVLADHLATATEAVEGYAPDAPDSAHNIAAAKYAAWLYDAPTAPPRGLQSAPMVLCGAVALLNPWRTARADTSQP